MLNKNIFLIFGVLLLVGALTFVSSYTPPTYDSVNFSLCLGYTPPTYDSINFTLGLSDVCDTCTYTTGNWNISLADYCIIDEDVDLGTNNITFYGEGNITFDATIVTCNVGGLPADQIGYVGSNAVVNYGVCS